MARALGSHWYHLFWTSIMVNGVVIQPCRAIQAPTNSHSSTVIFSCSARRDAIAWPPSSLRTLPRAARSRASSRGTMSTPAGVSSEALSFWRMPSASFGALGSSCFQSKKGRAL